MIEAALKTAEEEYREKFNLLSTFERDVFLAKVVHAVLHDDHALFYAYCIVEAADKMGLFDNVQFGSQSFKGLLFLNNKNSNMITDPKDKQDESTVDAPETSSDDTATETTEAGSGDDEDDDE